MAVILTSATTHVIRSVRRRHGSPLPPPTLMVTWRGDPEPFCLYWYRRDDVADEDTVYVPLELPAADAKAWVAEFLKNHARVD